MTFQVRNIDRDSVLATNVERANTFWKRFKGLLGKSKFPEGHGLWIEHCRSIHTHFMRFPIDVAFIGMQGEVIQVLNRLKPFRMSPYVQNALDVLELPAGTLSRTATAVGDRLTLEQVE